jgi:hypothetical protein
MQNEMMANICFEKLQDRYPIQVRDKQYWQIANRLKLRNGDAGVKYICTYLKYDKRLKCVLPTKLVQEET